jgi:NADH-quinone oxidoreductase subunit G
MAVIHIDGKQYEAKAGDNLLHACLSLGLDVPYFCWHPALHSVGACRQCAVKQFKDEKDTRGRIVMACMTPVADGMRISIDDPEARAFRAKIIEWLMASHPHDCPVCDEGGECHLQDMTYMTGHSYRRYRFRKATFRNQDLGPFIAHEMNRCIECYRCVRFYRDHAGGRDLNVFGSRDRLFFGRVEDGVLESEFSGNLAEVCPTGVFTDKTLARHYTRKWDLRMAPSVCVGCGLGCNTIPGERYGEVRRILNRYHHEVNGYFLCDRGRFGYEFTNGGRRIRVPLIRRGGSGEEAPATREEALRRIAEILAGGARLVGIGSPRASIESNFALRELVGPGRFSPGLGSLESRLVAQVIRVFRDGPVRAATVADVERSEAILVLGEDPTATAARLSLAIRQSVRQKPFEISDRLGIPRWHDAMVREAAGDAKGPLFIAAPWPTRLDDIATETFRAAPDDIARLGFAVAREIHGGAPAAGDLDEGVRALAGRIAGALRSARNPVVVSGIASGSEAVVAAASNVALALRREGKEVSLAFALPEADTMGAALLGGVGLEEISRLLKSGEAEALVVLENDLYRRAGASSVDGLLSAARHVIAIDGVRTGTSARAEIVLPSAMFAEGHGTLVSSEGRAQRSFQVFAPGAPDIQEGWRWVRDIALLARRDGAAGWASLDAIGRAIAATVPVLARVPDAAPRADFRVIDQKIPRMTHRATGRTAMRANVSVHEPKPPEDPDSPLSFTMEGYGGQPPAPLIPFYWAPGWNSVQSLNKFQAEVGGPLRGVPPGIRLLEPSKDELGFIGEVPRPFRAPPDQILVLPYHHLFGSDELSALGPAVASRAPRPYLALSPEDAAALGLSAGDGVEAALPGRRVSLPLEIRPGLPRGIAALPAGLPGLEGVDIPAWASVTKGSGSKGGLA